MAKPVMVIGELNVREDVDARTIERKVAGAIAALPEVVGVVAVNARPAHFQLDEGETAEGAGLTDEEVADLAVKATYSATLEEVGE